MDTIGRSVQPLPAMPALIEPPPTRPPRRTWLGAVAVALAVVLAATGVFAFMGWTSASGARRDVRTAETKNEALARRLDSLQGKLGVVRDDLASASEDLDSTRDYAQACHAALSAFDKAMTLSYVSSLAAQQGDLDRARALRQRARDALNGIQSDYNTCINSVPPSDGFEELSN